MGNCSVVNFNLCMPTVLFQAPEAIVLRMLTKMVLTHFAGSTFEGSAGYAVPSYKNYVVNRSNKNK